MIISCLSLINSFIHAFQFIKTDYTNQFLNIVPSSIIEDKLHQYLISNFGYGLFFYIPKKMLILLYVFCSSHGINIVKKRDCWIQKLLYKINSSLQCFFNPLHMFPPCSSKKRLSASAALDVFS